jgi:hypothetical protein
MESLAVSHNLDNLLKFQDGLPVSAERRAAFDHLLFERYMDDSGGWKRRLYYALKPVIPRPVQLALRRRYVAVQAAKGFPAWPIENAGVEIARDCMRTAAVSAPGGSLLRLGPWPKGYRAAFAITHDVEWDSGLRRAPAILEVERRVGFVASWNLVPERYPIDWEIVRDLRAQGGEIGIHGLKHDGRLFQSERVFRSRLKQIEAYAAAWGAVGFRSPSTLRNADWMRSMRFEYDSSFPDTDPYEPQPGGCCSPWPYFLGGMVELPLTMPQDHTVFEILGNPDLSLWESKVEWLLSVGGIILVNVHPDYMLSEDRLRIYQRFLAGMRERPGIWNALPADIARWWRDRSATHVRATGGTLSVQGPAADRAVIHRVRIADGQVIEEPLP